MPRSIVARAPTRIDFGGGWTDVPPYSDEEGGYVCNIAIDRYAVARVASTDGHSDTVTGHTRPAESALATAALRRTKQHDATRHPGLSLHSDFPTGAGLGGSSAAGVAALGALLRWKGESLERQDLAELSRRVEVEDLGVAGGRQDHYAAAFGGALGLSFSAHGVKVERIAISTRFAEELERRCVLVYTGESRISGSTITAVLDAYGARDPGVCGALHSMRELACHMAAALRRESVDDLAALVRQHWEHQRSLHPGISTPLIDRILQVAEREGSIGGKAMGASGGGCVTVIAESGSEERLRAAMRELGELLTFRIDGKGLSVEEEAA